MKNKNFTRFLCFFVCFCLCFAWFGEPMEAQASGTALLGILITFMLGSGIGFAISGTANSLTDGILQLVEEYETNVYDGDMDFWDLLALGSSIGTLGEVLLNKAAVDALNGFMNWLQSDKGWNEGEEIVTNQSSYLVPADIGTITVGGVTQQIQLCTNLDGSLYVGNDSSSFTAWNELNLGTFIPFSEGFSFQFGSVPFESANTAFYYDLDARTVKYEIYPSGTSSFNFDSFITNSLGIPLEEYAGMTFVLGCPRSGNTAYPQMIEVGFVRTDGTVKHCTGYYIFKLSRANAVTYSLFDNVEDGYTASVPDQLASPDTSDWDDATSLGLFNGHSGKIPSSVEEYNDLVLHDLNSGVIPEVTTDVIVGTPDDTFPDEDDGTIAGTVSGILAQIKALPQALANLILDGIKSIFVPDPDEINAQFMELLEEINNKYLFDFDLDSLFGSSKEPEDITAVYSLGDHEWSVTFVSWYYLKKAVEFFRPYIRGFIVLMLIFYNLRQFMAIFGLGGVMNGDSADRRVEDLAV